LLALPIVKLTPFTVTCANGEPVATSALPAGQLRSCSGVASERGVGVGSGKMIVRALAAASAWATAQGNLRGAVDVPISIVAVAWRTVWRSESLPPGPERVQPAPSAAGRA